LLGVPNSGKSTLLKSAELTFGEPNLEDPSLSQTLFENVLHEMQKIIYYGIKEGYLFKSNETKVRCQVFPFLIFLKERAQRVITCNRKITPKIIDDLQRLWTDEDIIRYAYNSRSLWRYNALKRKVLVIIVSV
jgi:hypothetical protein